MMGLSFPHILLMVAAVALLFGIKRLPGVMKDFGHGAREFRRNLADPE